MCSTNMSGKTLKFENTEVNKKEFHDSKQTIDLNLVDITKELYLTNLSIVIKVLNILLATKIISLDRYVLFCLILVDT